MGINQHIFNFNSSYLEAVSAVFKCYFIDRTICAAQNGLKYFSDLEIVLHKANERDDKSVISFFDDLVNLTRSVNLEEYQQQCKGDLNFYQTFCAVKQISKSTIDPLSLRNAVGLTAIAFSYIRDEVNARDNILSVNTISELGLHQKGEEHVWYHPDSARFFGECKAAEIPANELFINPIVSAMAGEEFFLNNNKEALDILSGNIPDASAEEGGQQ